MVLRCPAGAHPPCMAQEGKCARGREAAGLCTEQPSEMAVLYTAVTRNANRGQDQCTFLHARVRTGRCGAAGAPHTPCPHFGGTACAQLRAHPSPSCCPVSRSALFNTTWSHWALRGSCSCELLNSGLREEGAGARNASAVVQLAARDGRWAAAAQQGLLAGHWWLCFSYNGRKACEQACLGPVGRSTRSETGACFAGKGLDVVPTTSFS
jgi:hypothetical protein